MQGVICHQEREHAGGDLPSGAGTSRGVLCDQGPGTVGCGTANKRAMLELRKRKRRLFFSSATLELRDWNDSIDVCLLICLRAIRWFWHSQLLNVA